MYVLENGTLSSRYKTKRKKERRQTKEKHLPHLTMGMNMPLYSPHLCTSPSLSLSFCVNEKRKRQGTNSDIKQIITE